MLTVNASEGEEVILVDACDRMVGVEEKLAAHEQGLRHRAFSIFIFRAGPSGIELLLQQRQQAKYHSGALWTNTCCSHPRPGEDLLSASQRRLAEELNLSGLSLTRIGAFEYRSDSGNGLIEHEYDHILVGALDRGRAVQAICPNPAEVMDWRWIGRDALEAWARRSPEDFTAWFACAWEYVRRHWEIVEDCVGVAHA